MLPADRHRWYVVAGSPSTDVVSVSRRRVETRIVLPPVVRELAPGASVGLSDAQRGWRSGTVGTLHLLCRRLAGQRAGVMARMPLPPLETGLLGEIMAMGIGPDPGNRPGRRANPGIMGLGCNGESQYAWGAGPDPFPMALPLPDTATAMERLRLVATSPKVAPGSSWEVQVTTERRSAPYVVAVTMALFTEADLRRIAWTTPLEGIVNALR